ncbi:MAG TPA: two-component regulator propeller domain-containing protein, partial [Flavobacteriales bacterium]
MVNFSNSAGTDTVYYREQGPWQRFSGVYGTSNKQLHVPLSGDRLTVTHNGFVRQFNDQLQEVAFWDGVAGQSLQPAAAVARSGGGSWVASSGHGLARLGMGGPGEAFYPNGPKNSSVYRMGSSGGEVYVGTGGVANNWGNYFLKYGVHRFKENTWSTTDRSNDPLFATGANTFGGTVNDMMGVAVDPDDPDHVFVGSWDEGVVELRNGSVVQIHNPTNSSLQYIPISAAEGAVQVAGLTFDRDDNLWVTNSNCTSPISVRQKNGTWRAFNPGSAVSGNTLLSDIVVDDNGYKWMVRPRGSGLLVFDDGGTLGDTGDDRYKALNTSEGSGKLPSADVFSVAVDQDGEVWVGTGKGVAVFYNPFSVFDNSGGDAQQVLLEQDGNYQLLLETESVSAIAVDGGDRKWLGTQNAGVFLVSADGTELLEHFTADNSPLPGNNIVSIAIDGVTGEVFLGTDQGIVSFRGTATEGGEDAECASVFPNPVRETYTGPVAITGLMRDSDVRVTDVAGNLVYRTTSLGGQAIWPATDLNGQRVSTGVYLILASDASGTYSCNTKVVVVR